MLVESLQISAWVMYFPLPWDLVTCTHLYSRGWGTLLGSTNFSDRLIDFQREKKILRGKQIDQVRSGPVPNTLVSEVILLRISPA